ncbi:hypothetical protein GQ53DRAFT_829979 [Thozetella sp. PMI_491]|nr:hypothetical protein GQ53DRAFT_829979 [Thozetella sp. PMI_491]
MGSPTTPFSLSQADSAGRVRRELENLSTSPPDHLPTLPSTGSNPDKQPTYTTVGSVYNPDATPLQPPTRRGRSSRYQAYYSPPGELAAGFPTGILASFRDVSLGSPGAASTAHQYSPLQQNYDRAITPVQDTASFIMPEPDLPTPGMRSGNIPAPAWPGSSKQGIVMSILDDTESSGPEDSLTSRFNVKGLTNLASYPNPMQETARKALAKARNVNIGLVRPDTPTTTLRALSTNLKEQQLSGLPSASNSLATGPGAPQPLTAGPPGQRQYKPSTFEGAIKALGESTETSKALVISEPHNTEHIPSTMRPCWSEEGSSSIGFVEAMPKGKQVESSTAAPELQDPERPRGSATRCLPDGPHSTADVNVGRRLHQVAQDSTLGELSIKSTVAGMSAEHHQHIRDTEDADTIHKYYPRGFPKNYNGNYERIPSDWMKHYPLHPQSSRLIMKTQRDRFSKRDLQFYGGTNRLANGEFLSNAVMSREGNWIFDPERGYISTRAFARPPAVGQDVPVSYPYLSIEEANHFDCAFHARPLINMLFLTMQSYSGHGEDEDESFGSFAEAGHANRSDRGFLSRPVDLTEHEESEELDVLQELWRTGHSTGVHYR